LGTHSPFLSFLFFRLISPHSCAQSAKHFDPPPPLGIPEPEKKIPEVLTATSLGGILLAFVCDVNYFSYNPNQDQSAEWKFFLQVLIQLRHGYLFGFFKKDEKFLIPRFKEILQVDMPENIEDPPLKSTGSDFEILMVQCA
jgi:hypothetical protein